MVDIEKIKDEIVECLLPLKPRKIILFGSYANGRATDDSDIDLFLVKSDKSSQACGFDTEALLLLRGLITKYKIGFDVFSATQDFVDRREDHFYKVELPEEGMVIYGK